jgi:hypothetical protein
MGDRNVQVQLHQERMLRKGALGGERKKPRPDFCRLQADEFKGLDQGPVRERKMMIEEIPVRARRIADVRVKDQQSPSLAQHAMHLRESAQQILFRRKVLEEVACKDNVDHSTLESVKVRAHSLNHLDAGSGVGPHVLVEVKRDSPMAHDVVDVIPWRYGRPSR